MIVLDGPDTRANLPMPVAIEAARTAMRRFSAGEVLQPLRTVINAGAAGVFGSMPACVPDGDGTEFGVKTVVVKHENAARGLPSHNGLVLLFDGRTGLPAAAVDAAVLTEIRTAAVSAVATELLSAPDAAMLAILGTGAQARAHLEAVAVVRPGVRATVWGRTAERVADFVRWADKHLGVTVRAAASPSEATADADIVCTVTAARSALLTAADVRPGAHVNAVGASQPGAREIGPDLAAAATVVVDSREAAAREADDLLLSVDPPRRVEAHAELGELLLGRKPGRTRPGEITLFKSVGLGVQDLYAARAAVDRALVEGRGQRVTLRPDAS